MPNKSFQRTRKKPRAADLCVSCKVRSMTSSQHQPTIMDFFDFQSKNPNGSISMYTWSEDSKDRLYILNQYRKKLLQLVVKDEPSSNNFLSFAQIKIIPYAIDYAKVYADQSDDPKLVHVSSDLELTYHGGQKGDQAPKLHMKVVAASRNRYRTLVDCSLSLNSDLPRLAPICSLFAGYDYDKPMTDKVAKKSHVFKVDSIFPVRFDFYISGLNFNHHAFMSSMYSFNMFFSLDYLIRKEGGPLCGLPMVQPITGFAMKGYYLWVRCSKSSHIGKPFMQFYNNAVYYDKFMNRRSAWIDKEGRPQWSTMLDEEDRITASIQKEKSKGES